MPSEWLTTEAKKRVGALINKSGVLLETKVTAITNYFGHVNSEKHKVNIRSEEIIYSSKLSEQKPREVDQRLDMYEEFAADDLTGIQLETELPMECKSRQDVEFFGLAQPLFEHSHLTFPIVSELAGSKWYAELYEPYKPLTELNSYDVITLEIKDGKNPNDLYKEELIYKSASQLYDYVLTDILGNYEEETIANPLIENLLIKFIEYIKSEHYWWILAFRQWVNKNITVEMCEKFNQTYFEGKRISHMIHSYLPIVVVNGPLYRIILDKEMDITRYEEVPFLSVFVNKDNWLDSKRNMKLLFRSPKVPAILTNIEGLYSVLEIGLKWHNDIKQALVKAPAISKKRWRLESFFYERVLQNYANEFESFRSDLDFWDTLYLDISDI